MDIHWQRMRGSIEAPDYKDSIVSGNERSAWMDLVSMGRPMWKSKYDSYESIGNHFESAKKLVEFAATKLFLGKNVGDEASYNEATLFGVASMLCRLGVRPRSTSTLATLAVANFMAILAYVNKSHDGLVCSYASDPILTLGATQVWYAIGEGLPKYILPQLKKLMLNEMIDTKGTDAVARIILLLVMDTSVMLETHAGSLKSCLFTGQFVHVNTLLQVLGGSNWRVMKSKSENANKVAEHAFKAWLLQWEDWKLGFTHFLQLDREPNEDTLWFLLTRRAAGVFSLESKGSYLTIPVFCVSNISLILVKVKNSVGSDNNIPRSAEKMHPSIVFSPRNPMSKRSPAEMIRVYMSLRERVSPEVPTRFVRSKANDEASTSAKTQRNTFAASPEPPQYTFTFCIWSVRDWESGKHPVISTAVAEMLMAFVSPQWNPMELVRGDLHNGNNACLVEVMPDTDLLNISQRVLMPRSPKFCCG